MAQRSAYEQQILGYLQGTLGFSSAGAAGALGNLEVESGWNPTAANPNEGAIGIAQWEGGRRTSLDAYAAKTGGSEKSLGTQLGYLANELKNSYSGVLAYMRRATNPAAAAAEWDANYEGSAGTTRSARVSDAQTIYQQMASGAITGVTGGAASFGKAGAPPFKPSALKVPLSASQRASINSWLQAASSNKIGNLSKLDDAHLIVLYTNWYDQASTATDPQTPGQAIGNDISDVANAAFGWVAPLVIKASFSAAGLGMILVGASAAAHSAGA